MNTLFIHNTTYPPEIGKTDIIYYLKYFRLSRKDQDTDLFCFHGEKNTKESGIFTITPFSKRSIFKEIQIALCATIFIIKNRNKYRCIYILNPLIFGIIPAIFSKILGMSVIYDLRTAPILNIKIISKIIIFLESLIILIADKVIFINKDIYYQRGYFGLGRKIIHESLLGYEPYTDNLSSKKLLTTETNKKKFLYIGSLSKKRKLDSIIEAFCRQEMAILYMLGSGDDQERLKRLSNENIIFLGSCPHNQVAEYIVSADYGISFVPKIPQYDFQPPLKTIEYLGLGLPVLATNTEGNKKFINKKNGVFINDDTTYKSIIAGINEILAIKYDSEEIKKDSAQFAWQSIITKITKFIKI